MGPILRAERQPVMEDAPVKYLTFQLRAEIYAIEVMQIKKVIEYGEITHVPMVPDYVRGILNLLGEVVPVVDLPVCFGEAPTEATRRTCIVIVETRRPDDDVVVDVGIVVDTVNNVIELPPKDIAPPPALGNAVRTRFMKGVGKINEQFIILLEMDTILSLDELAVLEQVKQQAPAPSPTISEVLS